MRGSVVRRDGARGTVWYVVVTVSGKRRWIKVPGARNKGDAERYRSKLLAELDRGDAVLPKKVTVSQFILKWKDAAYPSLSPNTRHSYDAAVYAAEQHMGARQLSSIDREDIDKWRAHMLMDHAESTVKSYMVALQTAFKAAVSWRYIQRSPMDGVKRPAARRTKILPLTSADMQKLLAVADPQWRAIILMTVTGGLRMGEVCAARWEYLDMDAGTYTVSATAIQLGGHNHVAKPKTRRSANTVYLSPVTIDALRAHRTAQAAQSLAKGMVDGGWVFTRPWAGRWAMNDMRRVWQDLQVEAGIEHRRFHDLRHTCAAWLVESGAHPKVIQDQMRHASIATTLDTYGHLMPQRTGESVAQMDRMLTR